MKRDTFPRIVLVERSLRQHSGGSITGIIYWQADGLSFPDDSWDDFVVVILRWWVQAIMRLAERSSTVESLLFMDGPFAVRLSVEGSIVRVVFVRDDEVTASRQTGIRDLCRTIGAAAAAVLRACHTRKLRSKDVDELAMEVEGLRRCVPTSW